MSSTPRADTETINSYRRHQRRRVLEVLRSDGVWGLALHIARVVKFRYEVGGLKGIFLLGALGRGANEMSCDWDRRARLNARYFIASEAWRTEDEFWMSGERIVAGSILRDIELSHDATALEIGCGIGRLLKPLSGRVGRVIGVDVSPEMVRMAARVLGLVPSVEVIRGDGRSLSGIPDQSIDFCYSYVVFQHLPDVEILKDYFHEVARVVVPGGIFRFQTQCLVADDDTRSFNRGGTLMGIRVQKTTLARLLQTACLTVLEMSENATGEIEDLWVTARRDPPFGMEPNAKVVYHGRGGFGGRRRSSLHSSSR
jgi:ubiquinone/menaquinone biosynthesis C-methylase UbiE